MKAKVLSISGTEIETINLPSQFDEEIRTDLIQKSLRVIQANKRQSYGASPMAGKRASATLSRRRRNYKGSYGHGISRVPRKITWRRGTQFGWTGAFAPGTVGGRKAHPPKGEKDFSLNINKKEKKKAIRSAISITASKDITKSKKEPLMIIEDKLELLKKTQQVEKFLKDIGLKDELKRLKQKKVRAGKGKVRGRKYKRKKGPLFIVSKTCPLQKSVLNIPGIDIIDIKLLNVELLIPGNSPRKSTIYTKSAIERMEKEKLFK